jgi:hypothetical protein
MNYNDRLKNIIKSLEERGYIFKYTEEIETLDKFRIFDCDFFSTVRDGNVCIYFSAVDIQTPFYFVSKKFYADKSLPKNSLHFILENFSLEVIYAVVSKANLLKGMIDTIRWEMASYAGVLGEVKNPIELLKNIERLIGELENYLKSRGLYENQGS